MKTPAVARTAASAPWPEASSPARIAAPPGDGRCWLALDFPALPVAAMGLSGTRAPRAVGAHEGHRLRLLAMNASARAAGLQVGMSVSAATTVCAAVEILRHDAQAEAALLDGLACWAHGYSSQVSLQPPRGLLLEIGASLRLFGGVGPLLQRIDEDLRAMGHEVSRGVAPNPTAAWLFARCAMHSPVSTPERLTDHLSRLPLEALELSVREHDDLRALGLRTLGDCMRLPRDGLGRRFGAGLLALLDRALGRGADPRRYWQPPVVFQRRLDLAVESADRALLLVAVDSLLHELVGFLRARVSGACALELELAHRGVPATRLVLELVTPCRERTHLYHLLEERLQHLPIEHDVLYVGMRVTRLQALESATADLYAEHGGQAVPAHARGETDQRAELLVERLRARLGPRSVRVLHRVADHRPERSSTEMPWQAVVAQRGAEFEPVVGAPLWLLPRPLSLQGENGAPAMVQGPLEVERGPHRIESGWWDGDDVARDYYVARGARGTRYWIYRECREPARWYVHGIFA